ncbi:MAG: prolipoprotein diacylglyceryl transferase [Alphaproteobacteria bacterium]|nr:prolipoprotein diacylglyceryl transferase [Alphaproteobacteria bacterium]
MYPTLYEFGSLGFHSWGLMVMLGFIAAFFFVSRRVPRVGIDPDVMVGLYLSTVVGGLVGSRLLHFTMAEPETFFSNPAVFFDMGQGGFAFYGGVIGGTACGVVYALVKKLPPWKIADIAAPSIMIGLSLGRIGCFLAGCCHGQACPTPQSAVLLTLPGGSIVTTDGFPFIALNFVQGVGVGAIHGVPVYPTQLWESLSGFVMFLFLSKMWRDWRRFDGQVLASMLVFYAGLRSTIEEFRGDTIRGTDYFGLFSTSQVVSIGMVCLAVVIVLWKARGGLSPEAPFVPPPEDED